MKICILGENLTSLTLALMLVNKNFLVHLYTANSGKKISASRTIGISKSNIDFFNKEVLKIDPKKLWSIEEIEIFTEKTNKEKILSFKTKDINLFSLIKNEELYSLLLKKLKKNKFFKKEFIKNNFFYDRLIENNNFDLIFNCDNSNIISKKFFFKKVKKEYNDKAYTTIIGHSKISNNSASQIFTKYGPLAFLPISNNKTSVVYSINSKTSKFTEENIIQSIKKYNYKYSIKKFSKISNFKLSSLSLRKYYFKNIIAFGDLIHKIHPLAGQGFNMTLRDLKAINEIILNKIDLGLKVDKSIGIDFEKRMKHKNFLFSNGIDLIYEFFDFDRKIKNKSFLNIIKYIGKNKPINKLFVSYADKGIF